MRDLKTHKQKKVKTNRCKQEKQPRDWKKLFHRTLRICIASGSGFLLASGALLTAQMLLESGIFRHTENSCRASGKGERGRYPCRFRYQNR